VVRSDTDQQIDPFGNIVLRDETTEVFQLVADVLAKSLVLSHYESRVADIFDRVEPLAARLQEKGGVGASGKELLRHIGDVLSMQQTRSSLRVEWYIVLLIVAELLLTTYPLLLQR
jgi:uncharacterized Rmd1/YagE family protein